MATMVRLCLHFISFLLIILSVVSCSNDKQEMISFINFPEEGMTQGCQYGFPIFSDTINSSVSDKLMDLEVLVRYSDEFPYASLPLDIEIITVTDSIEKLTLEIPLFKNEKSLGMDLGHKLYEVKTEITDKMSLKTIRALWFSTPLKESKGIKSIGYSLVEI